MTIYEYEITIKDPHGLEVVYQFDTHGHCCHSGFVDTLQEYAGVEPSVLESNIPNGVGISDLDESKADNYSLHQRIIQLESDINELKQFKKDLIMEDDNG